MLDIHRNANYFSVLLLTQLYVLLSTVLYEKFKRKERDENVNFFVSV